MRADMPITIRPEALHHAREYAAIDAMLAAAFTGQTIQRRLVDAMRRQPEYRRQSSLVAVDGDDNIVGYVMVSVAWLAGPEGRREIRSLAPLGVHPAYQGQGVGGCLLQSAADAAQADGSPVLVLEGPPAYYTRHGFEPGPAIGIESNLTQELGDVAPLVRRLNTYTADCVGKVVFPPVFAATLPDPQSH